MPRNSLNLVLALLLCAITAAAYSQVASFDWVGYDDALYVTQNPNMRDGLSSRAFVWAWTQQRASNWHPLTMLSHALDCQVFGLWAGGHHLTNLLLHITNVVLLFVALQQLFAARTSATRAARPAVDEEYLPWKAAFVAAMFGVHPLHVESVAWIAERKDVLSTTFFFAALIAYAYYALQPSKVRMSFVTLSMACGLLAKPMLVTLPFVLLLLDYWPLRRLTRNSTGHERSLLAGVWEKWPLFVLSILFCGITFFVQRQTGAVCDLASVPFVDRLANAVVSYATYLLQAIWPVNLACFYPHPGTGLLARADFLPLVALSAVVLSGVTWFVIAARQRCPALLVGWFWFLGTLIPVIGFVQVGRQAMADRYTYIPLVGLLIAVAWYVPQQMSRVPAKRAILASVALIVIVTSSVLTYRQAATWRDAFRLWTHNLAVVGYCVPAHCGLAQVYAVRKQVDLAEQHCRRALEIDPQDRFALLCLAGVLLQCDREDEALESYTSVLESDSRVHQAWAARAEIYRRRGAYDLATADLHRAIELEPREASHHRSLAAIFVECGRDLDAVTEFQTALDCDSTDRATHLKLGELCQRLGRIPAAVEHFSAALVLEPGDRAVRRRLAQLAGGNEQIGDATRQ